MEIVKLLLKKNVGLNFQSKNGDTPLHIACADNNLKVAELLLKKGASPNLQDNSYHTPLHLTISILSTEHVIRLSTEHAKCSGILPSLSCSVQSAFLSIKRHVMALRLWSAARCRGVPFSLCLLISAPRESSAAVKFLWPFLIPTTVATSDETASPQRTRCQGRHASTNLLFGATPQRSLAQCESSDNRGESLIEDCQNGDTDKVNALLSELTLDEINYQNLNGDTLLSTACSWGKTCLALTLLDIEGVDVNLSDKKGWAPLHWASLNGHKNLTAALLSEGSYLRGDLDISFFGVKRFHQMLLQW
jgi:ankyrin repeat protein